jgi:septation ring formation regulator EzrA
MADELEQQLKRIETTVAEIVQAVRKLRDDQTTASEINDRLKRFLERKKQA